MVAGLHTQDRADAILVGARRFRYAAYAARTHQVNPNGMVRVAATEPGLQTGRLGPRQQVGEAIAVDIKGHYSDQVPRPILVQAQPFPRVHQSLTVIVE